MLRKKKQQTLEIIEMCSCRGENVHNKNRCHKKGICMKKRKNRKCAWEKTSSKKKVGE